MFDWYFYHPLSLLRSRFCNFFFSLCFFVVLTCLLDNSTRPIKSYPTNTFQPPTLLEHRCNRDIPESPRRPEIPCTLLTSPREVTVCLRNKLTFFLPLIQQWPVLTLPSHPLLVPLRFHPPLLPPLWPSHHRPTPAWPHARRRRRRLLGMAFSTTRKMRPKQSRNSRLQNHCRPHYKQWLQSPLQHTVLLLVFLPPP